MARTNWPRLFDWTLWICWSQMIVDHASCLKYLACSRLPKWIETFQSLRLSAV
ncbi:hypothetical protein BDZ85DRAFT_268202 [Elsinoe ampelina]|uniref:Uncharacterized protein n=1 Tax=Elsinoe ampelina TaxID=302913 RepID=A0A6A6G1T6_9PEZI|nr:hypothetical protein BDZ85DRAFT_268202 [Elsinoe ampelina]